MKSVTNVCKQFWNCKPLNVYNTRHWIHTPNFKFAAKLASCNTDKRIWAQKQLGLLKENYMLDEYERVMNCKVIHRNSQNITCMHLQICGRVDGIVENQDRIVEHKYRCTRLLGYVPFHEAVQCHLYMHMLKKSSCDLVECNGNSMIIHHIKFDDLLWDRVIHAIG
jgi:hypothetical protein